MGNFSLTFYKLELMDQGVCRAASCLETMKNIGPTHASGLAIGSLLVIFSIVWLIASPSDCLPLSLQGISYMLPYPQISQFP